MGNGYTEEWLRDYQARRGLKIEIVSVEPKPSKYRNKKTEVDGFIFDSKREATRYQDLKIMEREGLIRDLVLQKRYELEVNGIRIGAYVADFVYTEDGQSIVEDCKGIRTDLYKWKRKLMRAIYGIEIRET